MSDKAYIEVLSDVAESVCHHLSYPQKPIPVNNLKYELKILDEQFATYATRIFMPDYIKQLQYVERAARSYLLGKRSLSDLRDEHDALLKLVDRMPLNADLWDDDFFLAMAALAGDWGLYHVYHRVQTAWKIARPGHQNLARFLDMTYETMTDNQKQIYDYFHIRLKYRMIEETQEGSFVTIYRPLEN